MASINVECESECLPVETSLRLKPGNLLHACFQEKMAKEGSSRYSGADRKMEIAIDSKIVAKHFVNHLLGSA